MTKINRRKSTNRSRISCLACAMLALGLGAVAQAQTVTLNFDSLPSAQGWTYAGAPLAEDAAFLADGAKLLQTTTGSGSDSSATYEMRNVVNSNRQMILSFTARVLAYENLAAGSASTGEGFSIQIHDAKASHQLALMDSLVVVDGQSIALDTSVFHDYVFDAAPGRGFELFVDGSLVASGNGFGSGFSNRITFGDRSFDENSDVEITALSFVVGGPDIDVQKSVSNAFPMVDEPVEFTVRVNNTGDLPAASVIITDQLPAEMIIPVGTAVSTSVGSFDPATGAWSIGDMAAGDSAILSMPAVVTATQPPDCIVNTARSEFPDILDDTNDESRAAIHQPGVERCVDLDVTFGISAGPLVFPSQCNLQGRYSGSVDVINVGPDAARNVVVSIAQEPVVGPNLRFDDAACSNAADAQCNITEIAAGQTVSINVTSDLYQSPTTFQQTLSVSATTSDSDYDLSNNSPSGSGSAGGFSSCEEFDFELGDVAIAPGCFIATAAYGTPMHADLDTLRDFRDRFMLTNRPGQALVHFYYRYSPPMADYIAERDWLRAVVRGLLAPIIYTIKNPLPAGFLITGLVAAAVVRRRRRAAALAREACS